MSKKKPHIRLDQLDKQILREAVLREVNRQVDGIREQAYMSMVDTFIEVCLVSAWDTFKPSKKRMREFNDKLNMQFDCIYDKKIKHGELRQIIEEEIGIPFVNKEAPSHG